VAEKKTAISVRIADSDATFLNTLNMPEATSQSDKIRVLIKEARQLREGKRNYNTGLDFMQEMHAATQKRRVSLESETGMHSELVRFVSTWSVEMEAYLLSGLTADGANDDTDAAPTALKAFEVGIAERMMLLIDTVLRMGLTQTYRCYDPKVVSGRIEPILELCRMITAARASVEIRTQRKE